MSSAAEKRPEGDRQVYRLIGLGLMMRLIVDSGVQIFFPFLGVISGGIGATPELVGRLVSLRSAMGLLAPVFGSLADRRGYRMVLSAGLALAAAGNVVIGLSQGWRMMAVGMVLTGIGTFAFGPTFNAYLSGRLPFRIRARGLGIVEYAWALTGIVGLSTIGVLIEWTSWRVPFYVIAAGLGIMSIVILQLPSARDGRETAAAEADKPKIGLIQSLIRFFDLGDNARSAWAVIFSSFFIAIGGFTLILSHGVWLQDRFGLEPADLGGVAFILGFSDLIGSVSVSLINDHIGKRRAVLIGAALSILGFIGLSFINSTLFLSIVGIFLARAAFEFSIVGNMVLQSEQFPAQRGKLLTIGAALTMIGSTIVGFIAIPTLNAFGIAGISGTGVVAFACAFLLTFFFARESADSA